MADRIRHRRWWAPAAIVAAIALGWWLINDGGFWREDDFQYFHEHEVYAGRTGDFLRTVYYQHFAPLHRLTFVVANHATVRSWHGVVLLELAMIVVAMAAFYGSMVLLFGRSSWLLIPLAMVTSSVYLAIPLAWPSAGLQGIPDVAAGTVGLYTFLLAHHRKQARWAWLSALVLALGLLFYIRPLVTAGVLVLVRYLFLQDDLRPKAIVRSAWDDRWIWAPYALVVVVYLGYVLGNDVLASPASAQPLPVDQIPKLIELFLFGNLLPSVAGLGPAALSQRTVWQGVVVVVVYGAALVVLVGSFVRKRSAWRGWAFVLAVIAASLALVTTGRLRELGPVIGYDLRYYTNLPWMLALGVMFALSRQDTLRLGQVWAARLRGGWIAAAVTVAIVALSLDTAADISRQWGGQRSRKWSQTVVRTMRLQPRPQIIDDDQVPPYVMDFAGKPRDFDYILPLLGISADRYAQSDGLPTLLIGGDGVARPVRFVQRAITPAKGCIRGPATLDVTSARPLASGKVAVLASGPPGTPGLRMDVAFDVGQGFGPPTRALVPAPDGRPAATADLPSLRAARMFVPAGANMCGTSLAIGELVPDPSG